MNARPPITLYTIGFAGRSAEEFFEALQSAGVKKIVDVRLRNVSQLAGFAKRTDLEYFSRVILGAEYRHELALAPTKDLLESYRRKEIDWQQYARAFNELMLERRPDEHLDRASLDAACLLCSERDPEQCHRRLVAEFLSSRWDGVDIRHL